MAFITVLLNQDSAKIRPLKTLVGVVENVEMNVSNETEKNKKKYVSTL